MALRLITGQDAREPQSGAGLTTLYRSPSLIIQGSRDVMVWKDRTRSAFLLGELAGDRSPSRFKRLLGEDQARCRELLEGRYVLARVEAPGRAVVMTDRFGQMDLYMQETGGVTTLATDMSLLPVARGAAAYDQAALAHTLCVYGYRPPKQHTLYQGVRRLGVDQWVEIQAGRIEIHEEPFEPVSAGAWGQRELNQYADILLDAVESRGSRRGNVVSLSSGWDSTALLACLVNIFGRRKVRAVTARMIYAERSGVINQFEVDRAKAMAEYFGVRLDVVDLDYRTRAGGPDVADRIRSFVRARQLQSMNTITLTTFMERVAKTTPGDEVVFVGEISDGAHNLGFSQFTTIFHPVLEFREYSDKMASYLFGPTAFGLIQEGQLTSDPIYQLLRGRSGSDVFDEPAADARARRQQLLSSFFLRAKRMPFWSLKNHRLLTPQGQERYQTEMERVYLAQASERVTPQTLYAWYLHLYNSFFWQGSTIASRALTAQAHGLRLALPFWDSRLQALLSAMPESAGRGLDLNPTKYPLKWTLKHRLDYPFHLQVGPHSYLYDVDPGFSHSAEILYGSTFAAYFKERLASKPYRQALSHEVFNLGYLDELVDQYLGGTQIRGGGLNDLLSLCLLVMSGWYGMESPEDGSLEPSAEAELPA